MKHFINLVLLVLLPSMIANAGYTNRNISERVSKIKIESKPKVELPTKEVELTNLDELVEALIMVESAGNDSAIGDTHMKEPSVGVLQIRPIMVREVNRILKLKGEKHRFKLKDRFSREKSIQMFLIWKEFHHKDSDFEVIARSWNGGSKGPKNPRTYNYWKKVENQLANL